jgi:hypothetical protein
MGMSEQRQTDEDRVTFESLVPVQIMAIDGTWAAVLHP